MLLTKKNDDALNGFLCVHNGAILIELSKSPRSVKYVHYSVTFSFSSLTKATRKSGYFRSELLLSATAAAAEIGNVGFFHSTNARTLLHKYLLITLFLLRLLGKWHHVLSVFMCTSSRIHPIFFVGYNAVGHSDVFSCYIEFAFSSQF